MRKSLLKFSLIAAAAITGLVAVGAVNRLLTDLGKADASVITSAANGGASPLQPDRGKLILPPGARTDKPLPTPPAKAAAASKARIYGLRCLNSDWDAPTIVSFSVNGDFDLVEHSASDYDNDNTMGGVYIDGYYLTCSGYSIYKYDTSDWSRGRVSTTPLNQSNMNSPVQLTYNPADSKVYGVFSKPGYNAGYFFGTLDMTTGTATKISDVGEKCLGLASDAKGNMFMILQKEPGNAASFYPVVYKVNPANGQLTQLCKTSVSCEGYHTSAVFDFKSKTLFWFVDTPKKSLYEIDTTTGEPSLVMYMPNNEEMVSVFIPFVLPPGNAPALLEDLDVKFTDANGSATVTFTTPDVTYDGDPLTGDVTYTITEGDNTLKTGTLATGSDASIDITVATRGNVSIAVKLKGGSANAESVNDFTAYSGADAPLPPSDVTATADRNSLSASWTAPAAGANGGFINTSSLTYKVTLMPAGTVLEESTSATSISKTLTLTEPHSVWVEVTPTADGVSGTPGASNRLIAGPAFNMPYSEDFATEDGSLLYTIEDTNADGITWQRYSSYSDQYYECPQSSTEPKDDWIFTPALHLESGKSYTLTFKASSLMVNAFPEEMEVKIGTKPAAASMTGTLLEKQQVKNAKSFTWFDYSLTVIVENTGDYHIGFHAMSAADRYKLAIDNISIEGAPLDAPACATALEAIPAPWGVHTATLRFHTPTTTVGGSQLTGIDKAEIYLNKRLFKTIQQPATDADMVVTLETEEGNNDIDIYCFNSAGRGFAASSSVWTGKDMPAPPANFRATVVDGGIKLTWDTPVGANGGMLDTEGFSYALARYVNGEQTVLAYDTGAVNSYTDEYTNDEQVSLIYLLQAYNNIGTSPSVTSNTVIFGGEPYALPFAESFAGGFTTYAVWQNQSISGLGTWRIWGANYDTEVTPADSDNGAIVFHPNKEGDKIRIFSGNIDFSAARNPVLQFSYRGYNSSQKLTVEACRQSEDWQSVGEFTLTPADNNEWKQVTIPLSRFNSLKNCQIAFVGEAIDLSRIYVDNILIRDVFSHDLGISLNSRHNFFPGEPQTITATVSNVGENPAASSTVEFYRDGTLIDTVTLGEIAAGTSTDATTTVTVDMSFPDESDYTARVIWTDDNNNANNLSNAVTVRHHLPLYPAPRDLTLTGSTDNSYDFAWTEPEPWVEPASKPVTDDFESYEPFIIDEIGDWTVIDQDGEDGTFGLIGLQFPYREAAKSFQVFNLWALGIEMGDDEVTWRPASGHQFLVAFADKDRKNDDWLISPLLSGDAQTISFYGRSLYSFYYGYEEYEVLVSFTGKDMNDFKSLEKGTVPDDWTKVSVDLPEGARYFAIKCISNDAFAMGVDDITYIPGTGMPENPVVTGYNFYVNDSKVNTSDISVTNFTTAGTADTRYAVTAVYGDAESRYSNVVIPSQTGIVNVTSDSGNLSVTSGKLSVTVCSAGNSPIELFSADGRKIATAKGGTTVTIPVAAPGLYIVRAGSASAKTIVR